MILTEASFRTEQTMNVIIRAATTGAEPQTSKADIWDFALLDTKSLKMLLIKNQLEKSFSFLF